MSAGSSMRRGIIKSQNESLKKPTALEQLDSLVLKHNMLATQSEKAFKNLVERISNGERVVGAIIELLGPDVVQTKVREIHIRELEAEADQTAKQIEAAVTKGDLIAVDGVFQDQCIVVTQQIGSDGIIKHPTLVQLPLDGYVPEIKELLKSKRVNETLTLPSGDTLKVIAVYETILPKESDPVSESLPITDQDVISEPTDLPARAE